MRIIFTLDFGYILQICASKVFIKVPGFLSAKVELVHVSGLKTSLLLILFLLSILLKTII
jgi:hypothetical protein